MLAILLKRVILMREREFQKETSGLNAKSGNNKVGI